MSLLKKSTHAHEYTHKYFIYSQCLLKLCQTRLHLNRAGEFSVAVVPSLPRPPCMGADLLIMQPAYQPLPGKSKAILF